MPAIRQNVVVRQRTRARNRAIIDEARRRACADCGGEFPACCMVFHHVEPKMFNVGGGAGLKVSKAQLLAEIAKCVIVCSNCHCVRHAREDGEVDYTKPVLGGP